MRIGINTLALLDTMAGAECYAKNIISNLAKIDKENHYYLFLSSVNHKIYQVNQDNFKNIIYKFPAENRILRVFYEQFILPREVKKYKLDILFSPTNVAPLKLNCVSVVMIFDLHWFFFPHLFNKLRNSYVTYMIKNAVKKADMILTLSESSKTDIVKLFNIAENKIKITPCAVNDFNYAQEQNICSDHGEWQYNKPYLLFVGQTHKRKNVTAVIKAYFMLKKEKNIPHKLILVGRPGDAQEEIEKLINKLNLSDFIEMIGYVKGEDLPDFYKGADLFIYPSLYEGFGMPILEAMSFGIPVITSNVSSLPEVAGSAAVLVDPYKIEDLVFAVMKVLQNKPIREKMIEEGYRQVQKFNWADSAGITLEAFNQVYQERNKKI